MAFTRVPSASPVSIGDFVITLHDRVEPGSDAGLNGDPTGQTARFRIRVLMSDGTIQTRQGDLAPHITAAERTALMDFMDTLRARAEAQLL